MSERVFNVYKRKIIQLDMDLGISWTHRLLTLFGEFVPIRNFKIYEWYHLKVFKSYLIFQSYRAVAQKMSLPSPYRIWKKRFLRPRVGHFWQFWPTLGPKWTKRNHFFFLNLEAEGSSSKIPRLMSNSSSNSKWAWQAHFLSQSPITLGN